MIKFLRKRSTIIILSAFLLTFLLFGADLKPKVQKNMCTGCGDCIEYCPVNAIEEKNEKAVIIVSKCINCKLCVTSCTNDAIK